MPSDHPTKKEQVRSRSCLGQVLLETLFYFITATAFLFFVASLNSAYFQKGQSHRFSQGRVP